MGDSAPVVGPAVGPVVGVLLAAGAGRRMGTPKALVRDGEGTSWLRRGVAVLSEGGCDAVVVVLGAQADDALPLVAGTGASAVVAADWAAGMSASLRAGLGAAQGTSAEVAVVHLVDLPDVSAPVVARVLGTEPGPRTLRRAAYAGRPGHPVVLGRDHWAEVLAGSSGDQGARAYLVAHGVELVECRDLASGADVDSRQR